MNNSTISSLVTSLWRAMRNCPRNGSRVPSVAAIATETNARLRWSRPGLDHESPNACLVANRRKSSPDRGSPMPNGSSSGLPNNSAACSNAATSAGSLCAIDFLSLRLRDHIRHVMQDAVPGDLPLAADAAQVGVVVAGLDGSDGALDTEGPLRPAACRAGGSEDLEDDELGVHVRPVTVDLDDVVRRGVVTGATLGVRGHEVVDRILHA